MCMKYREGGFYLMLSFWVHICSLCVHKFGKLMNSFMEYALWDVTFDVLFVF